MRRCSWTLVHMLQPRHNRVRGVSPPKHQAKISPGPDKVHTEWGKLMADSREFKEIKQSCETFSGENATFCWGSDSRTRNTHSVRLSGYRVDATRDGSICSAGLKLNQFLMLTAWRNIPSARRCFGFPQPNRLFLGKPFGGRRPASARLPVQSRRSSAETLKLRPAESFQVNPSAR
jgi:hypothetical protein